MSELLIFSVNILFLFILSYAFYQSREAGLKEFYWPFLLIKLTCGILYGLLYIHYYSGGDTFSYFNEALKIAHIAKENFNAYLKLIFFNENEASYHLHYSSLYHSRAFWMSKATSVILLVTNNNYWLSSCYLSLFSFWGIYSLSESLLKLDSASKTAVVVSFFLFPSFVFWSSGLTKESIAIGALFYLISVCIRIYQRENIRWLEVLLVLSLGYIEWKIRFFYLTVLLLTFGSFLIYHFLIRKLNLRLYSKLLLIGCFFIVTIVVLSQMEYALHFSNFIEILVETYQIQFEKNPYNAIVYHQLEPNIFSVILNSPWALLSGLFRPSLLDTQKGLMIIVGIENLILLGLLILRVRQLKYSKLEWTMWSYVLILALFLALSSPNFGTLTRYKVGFLPLFLYLLLKEHPIINKYRKLFK